jgi:hypothetical protein
LPNCSICRAWSICQARRSTFTLCSICSICAPDSSVRARRFTSPAPSGSSVRLLRWDPPFHAHCPPSNFTPAPSVLEMADPLFFPFHLFHLSGPLIHLSRPLHLSVMTALGLSCLAWSSCQAPPIHFTPAPSVPFTKACPSVRLGPSVSLLIHLSRLLHLPCHAWFICQPGSSVRPADLFATPSVPSVRPVHLSRPDSPVSRCHASRISLFHSVTSDHSVIHY